MQPTVIRVAVLVAGAVIASACSSGPTPAPVQPSTTAATQPAAVGARVADDRLVRGGTLTAQDRAMFDQAWALFVARDSRWTAARDQWLARGGAAPYVLAENLFRQFWSASKYNNRVELSRVAYEAKAVGEPAVAYFAKPLVTDLWPLPAPVTQMVFNPDNPREPIEKTFHHFDIDDLTRQHATFVLAAIGPPSVPTLTSPAVLRSSVASAPRYAAYALGAIGTPQAIDQLGVLLRTRSDWQDRAAAAKGLGFALRKDPSNAKVRALLEGARGDPDRFVREKVEEGLAGRTTIDL